MAVGTNCLLHFTRQVSNLTGFFPVGVPRECVSAVNSCALHIISTRAPVNDPSYHSQSRSIAVFICGVMWLHWHLARITPVSRSSLCFAYDSKNYSSLVNIVVTRHSFRDWLLQTVHYEYSWVQGSSDELTNLCSLHILFHT